MKFIAEISITPTSFEIASLNFVRINFNPSFKMRARNFIILHNFKNNCFGEYRWCASEKCDIKVLIVCPNTCHKIVCGHFSRQTQSRFLVNAPLRPEGGGGGGGGG